MVKTICKSPSVTVEAKWDYNVEATLINLNASGGITLECEGTKVEVDPGRVKIKSPKIVLDSPKTVVSGRLVDPNGCDIKF